jgi:exodeoxyribonuclease VII large subunit
MMAFPQEVPIDNCLTVKELAQQIKKRLESGFQFIRLRGEVSGVTYHKSGHVYFSLKDSDAVIDCIAWKGLAQSFSIPLTDGLEIIGRGSVTTYMGRSKYQFIMDSFEPAGRGALFTLLEQRRQKLQGEGLFDVSRKQSIPRLPKRIGLITSSEGAVLHDIEARLEERYIEDTVYLWPVTVQGENTPRDIIAAIQGFHRFIPRPDVLIIARGGGSFEDLWHFNDEELVRVIRGSEIPIITAIGHEPDTPLIDYASDKRASTPTNAAEIVAPRKEDICEYLQRLDNRMSNVINASMQKTGVTLQKCQAALQSADVFLLPRLRQLDQIRLDQFLERFHVAKRIQLMQLSERCISPAQLIKSKSWLLANVDLKLMQGMDVILNRNQNQLSSLNTRLDTSNFVNILRKGFAILHDEQNQLIQSVEELQTEKTISIRLQDGVVCGFFRPKSK